METVHFSRKPYTVTYKDFHTGELVRVTRRPPPKLHPMLPTDIVELKTKKNEDWPEDAEYTIKSISPRQPNTIQIENDEGAATFVPYSDLNLVEEVAYRPGKNRASSERYLSWP